MFITHDEMQIVRLYRQRATRFVLAKLRVHLFVAASLEMIVVRSAVAGTSFWTSSSSLSATKSALPFAAPCPIVTKDGLTRLFLICLGLIRAEIVSV